MLKAEVSSLLQECLGASKSDADRIALALADVKRFRLHASLRLLRRAASPFDVFFFIESLIAAKKHKKCRRVIALFNRCARAEHKVELVAGWSFTKPYRFGSPVPRPLRHVMFDDCSADTVWWSNNVGFPPDPLGCTTGLGTVLCPCVQWIRDRPAALDRALAQVIGHLCDMRHSLVHESWPLFMVAEHVPGADGSTMLDMYPCDPDDHDIFRTYEAGISFERFRAISVATALNYLNAAHP